VAQLIESVAGDVLGAVAIEFLKGFLVRTLLPGGNASQFGILLPQVGFNEFGCGYEAQDGGVARGERFGDCASASPSVMVAKREPAERAAPAMPTPLRNERRLTPFGMERQRSRSTQLGGDLLSACSVLQSFRKDLREIMGGEWIHRKMKVGGSRARGVTVESNRCQLIPAERRRAGGGVTWRILNHRGHESTRRESLSA